MNARELEILLVEDNSADVELILHALRVNSVTNRIRVAGDGEEALDLISRREKHGSESAGHKPLLVLLDSGLPKIDGLQVLREIRSDPSTCYIPVVMLTSSREERDLIQSYHLGVEHYIQKPVDFFQFKEVIKQLGLYWLVVSEVVPAVASEW
jgi:two-component system, response regulator